MTDLLGGLARYCDAGVIAGIAFVAMLIVQIAKKRNPTVQGRVTVLLVFAVALVLAVLAQGALWEAGEAAAPWSFAGVLGVLLNALLGGCGAIGVNVSKDALLRREV